MANKDDYLTYYRQFFENFAQTLNPNDQLPVKLASYKLVNVEVVGGIIDWTSQYLSQKKCPPNLFAPLIKIVIDEIRKACKKHPINCGFNPSDNAYEPLKLMQTVMAKTNEVCLRYLDNSMLCSLPSPDVGSSYYLTSVCAVKNTRRRMEDRHVIIHDLNTMFNIQEASPSSYYAVFDGHAGHDAAAYSSAHLHQFLAENKCFISNPKQALLDAFCKTDALFIDKCRVEHLNSGTTALVALLRPKEKMLYVAWAGDSQAVLVSRDRVIQLVNPHKPCREDEKERIEKQGGCVILWGTWRVNGQLAVSRAIGDPDYKPYVTAIPDIQEILLGSDDFLVLACDGLWDSLSEEMVASAVYNLVTENPDDTDRISQRLVHLAKEQGSTDNISVIVVFLREPSKIAAEAYWANRNLNTATMEEGFNNANNPFGVANGGTTDNIITPNKTDGLLLNLSDKFKQNGTDLSPDVDFFSNEKSNGKRPASDFEDDDFGPETDVDAIDALSPGLKDVNKTFADNFATSPNNNPNIDEGVFNPFMEHQEKAALEMEKNMKKRETTEEFDDDEDIVAREETPTPPADGVHDDSGLVENPGDSDSEDEWSFIKGNEANKENISPQPDKEVAHIPEEDDTMSQLNPNAAEFVPVSPTRSIPSPACRLLINDPIVSQSPRKANDVDLGKLPSPNDFENEVKSRPSDVAPCNNGVDENSEHNTPADLMENILNGKNIDEIPEFHPSSTPTKSLQNDKFHFGPHSAPFTPKSLNDTTNAVYGDESAKTLGTTFNESIAHDLLDKESDPMSMSFYADKGESNPFDLNKVQTLPDDIEEFLNVSNHSFNDTISDLPEHNPAEELKNNDLDKQKYDDEKELASPLEPEPDELDFSKTPEPTNENLLGKEFCNTDKKNEELVIAAEDTSEVSDLLATGPHNLPPDVELLATSPQNVSSGVELPAPSPQNLPVDVELLPTGPQNSDLDVELENVVLPPEPRPVFDEESPICDKPDLSISEPKLICQPPVELHTGLEEAASPTCDNSDKPDLILIPQPAQQEQIEPPVCDRPESLSSVCDLSESKSPMPEEPMSAGSDDFTKPEFIEQAQHKFEELCKPLESPQEEVTTSVKDDLSEEHSKSPVIEDNFIQEYTVAVNVADFHNEPKSDVHTEPEPEIHKEPEPDAHNEPEPDVHNELETDVHNVSEPEIHKEPEPDVHNKPEPDVHYESEAYVHHEPESDVHHGPEPDVYNEPEPDVHERLQLDGTADVNSNQGLIQAETVAIQPTVLFDLEAVPPQMCVYPLKQEKEVIPFEVKTENISPEFAEPAIVSPSEESKTEEPITPTLDEPEQKPPKEPLTEKNIARELDAEMTAVGVVGAVAASAALTAVMTELTGKTEPEIIEEMKLVEEITPTEANKKIEDEKKTPEPKKTPTEKKKPLSASAKKPAVKSAPAKSPASEKNLSPLAKGSAASPAAPKLTTKPATPKSAGKPSEPRTLTGKATGATKPALTSAITKVVAKANPTLKKTGTDATAAVAAKPKSSASALNASSKVTSQPKVPAKTSSTVTSARVPLTKAPVATARPATAPKRTTTMPNKTGSATDRPSAISVSKTTATKVTSKPTTASSTVPPKPKSATSVVPPKPKVPLTKRVPPTDKQVKENANKITASRTTVASKTMASAKPSSTSTIRKVETKVTSSRTTVTSKSATKSVTNVKKPAELVKTTAVNKTKTTKIEKPKQNGISTVVTEEITIVNNTNNVIENQFKDIQQQQLEPELIKDNSPVDNKIIETQLVHSTAD